MASSSVVGLDIGSSQIKAVHVERHRNRWTLLHAGIVPTPEDSVQDGVILDATRVAEAVRDLFRNSGISAHDTVAAVSGSHILVRTIRVPDMNAATLKRSIRFEAAKHVDPGANGISIENSALEYEVLGKSGTPPQLEVLLVVAPQPMVNARVDVIENSGMEAVAVDVEAFALQRVIESCGLMPGPGQATAIMNLGATYTDLNIVVGEEVVVTRSIPIGGNALTSSVASVMNVSVQEAEEHKRHVDISPETPEDDLDGMISSPNPARQVTVPFVDELIRELRRSIIYFQSQAAEAGIEVNVDRLVLVGGGTQLPGLPEYLRERLGLEVIPLDPLAQQRAGAADHWRERGPELAVAVGLALKDYN